MSEKKKFKKGNLYLVRCIRCGKNSHVDAIAKCKYCGSYAVKLVKRENNQ